MTCTHVTSFQKYLRHRDEKLSKNIFDYVIML